MNYTAYVLVLITYLLSKINTYMYSLFFFILSFIYSNDRDRAVRSKINTLTGLDQYNNDIINTFTGTIA